MRKTAFRAGFVLALGLAACSSSPVSSDNPSAFSVVSVSHDVKMPDSVSFIGTAETLGAIGGALGALLTTVSDSSPNQIKTYLAQQNIDVGQIVRTQFINGLQNAPRYSGHVGENGDAHFELEVFLYGLIKKGTFSSTYKPWLGIRAKLVDRSGKVLWEDKDYVAQYNDTDPEAPYKDYFADPAVFRDAFTASSQAVTGLLLKDLQLAPGSLPAGFVALQPARNTTPTPAAPRVSATAAPAVSAPSAQLPPVSSVQPSSETIHWTQH